MDIITDFKVGSDTIVIDGFDGVTSFADLDIAITDGGALLRFENHNINITTTGGVLSATDFDFA
jgi:hypothetical protein